MNNHWAPNGSAVGVVVDGRVSGVADDVDEGNVQTGLKESEEIVLLTV